MTLPSPTPYLRPTRITEALTGSLDNFDLDPGFDYFSLSLGFAPTITGFKGGTDGEARVVYLVNSGGNDIDIANQNAGSDAANRIITTTGATVSLIASTRPTVTAFVYDPFAARWRML